MPNKLKSNRMSSYQKHIIVSSVVGLLGIPIFVINHNDYSWQTNRESYWGMIALLAMALGVIMFYFANKYNDH